LHAFAKLAFATQGILMPMSNTAVRMEYAAPDLLSEPPRPVLRVITNNAPIEVRDVRPRRSLDSYTIVIRDQGFRPFRVY
jgi:hypothetical protein